MKNFILERKNPAENHIFDIGRKFLASGQVLEFEGNTFISHLEQQGKHSEIFNRVLDLYRELQYRDLSRKIVLLPPSSYHITAFEGFNNLDRNDEAWPATIRRDLPIHILNNIILEKLKRNQRPETGPLCYHLNDDGLFFQNNTLQIPLITSDDNSHCKLLKLRDYLASVTGLRRPDHQLYKSHITIAYKKFSINRHEAEEVAYLINKWVKKIMSDRIEFQVPKVTYCIFSDMFFFQELLDV